MVAHSDLSKNDVLGPIEIVLMVSGDTPGVSALRRPAFPWSVKTPLAEIDEDWSAGGVERFGKKWVKFTRVFFVVAVVHLKSKGKRIKPMDELAFILGAGNLSLKFTIECGHMAEKV